MVSNFSVKRMHYLWLLTACSAVSPSYACLIICLDIVKFKHGIQLRITNVDFKCKYDYENRFQMQIICGLQVWNTNVDFQCRFQKLIIKVNFKCGFQMLKRFSYVSFQFMCFCLWGITKLNTSINWSCRFIFVTIYRGSAADYFGICC